MTTLEVGRIAKSHGVRGDVLIKFSTDIVEVRARKGSELIIDGRVYIVTAARPHQKYRLVTFEGVTDRNQADLLRGKTVLAEPLEGSSRSDVPDEAVFVHEVIGATVVDQDGTDRGVVVSVIDNPASDLMELDSGALVPFNFIVKVSDQVVQVEVPAGLFELLLDDGDQDSEPTDQNPARDAD